MMDENYLRRDGGKFRFSINVLAIHLRVNEKNRTPSFRSLFFLPANLSPVHYLCDTKGEFEHFLRDPFVFSPSI